VNHHTRPEAAHSFDDSAGYERFIGHWGRAAGIIFLDWLAPPPHADWLDVGCGTGLFTDLVVERCSPARMIAIDQVEAQIAYARRKPVAGRADFRVADAQMLPFADSTFNVVASALVLNFIPDRAKALSEMRRVAVSNALVAAYVWDFVPELSPSGPFRRALCQVAPDIPALPGTNESGLEALARMFERAGFADIATRSIDVTVEFPDFAAFWSAQTPSYSPLTKMVAAMSDRDRRKFVEILRADLNAREDGTISYLARANAVKARAPYA